MPLGSKAHIKLGDHEFILDESVPDHYAHSFQALLNQSADPGKPLDVNLRVEKLKWSFDDWSGGEGNRIFYPDDPTVYHYADGSNGRIRGQLTGRPARVSSSLATDEISAKVFLVVAGGLVWALGGRKIHYSADGITWTAHAQNAAPTLAASTAITAVAGADDYLYVSSWKTGGGGAAPGTRYLYRVDTSTVTEVITGGTANAVQFMGMAFLRGYLYGWTGRKLWEHDVFETLPLTVATQVRKQDDLGVDLVSGTTYYGDCVAGDQAIYYFLASTGRSRVYEYRHGVAQPIWAPGGTGFTAKSLVFHEGLLYAPGHFGGEGVGNGRGCMYALRLTDLAKLFIGWFRKDSAFLQMQEGSGSYGNQMMTAGAYTGRIFIYDADLDAISMLDDLPHNFGDTPQKKIGALITFSTQRIAAVYTSGGSGSGNYTVYSYEDDEPGVRETNIAMPTLQTGQWDFGFSSELKTLNGFHVTFRPLDPGQSITISYDLDGHGFVVAGTITDANDGSPNGREFIPVSDGTNSKRFYALKYRIDASGTGGGVFPPMIFNVTAEAALLAKTETWDLVLRIKDERQENGRPKSRAVRASVLRTYIEDLIRENGIVTMLDGYKKQRPGDYDTHVVMVLEGTDSIARGGEGTYRVRLLASREED